MKNIKAFFFKILATNQSRAVLIGHNLSRMSNSRYAFKRRFLRRLEINEYAAIKICYLVVCLHVSDKNFVLL